MKIVKDQAVARIVVRANTKIRRVSLDARIAWRGPIRTTKARITAKPATEVITRTKLAKALAKRALREKLSLTLVPRVAHKIASVVTIARRQV